MPDHELDVQTCLTTAIPRYVEHLGELTGKFINFKTKTPPNSEQPTDLPRGVGVDVLAILDARKALALEAKKVEHQKARLNKVDAEQVEFLERLEKNARFESYIVFDRLPNLHFDGVENYLARRIAQLNSIVAIRPAFIANAIENIGDFIGPKANGLTMLDVITRAAFEQPNLDPNAPQLLKLLADNLPAMNNCILWFFGDDYVRGLTLDQARAALSELLQTNSVEGKMLRDAYDNLQLLKKSKAKAGALKDAKDAYDLAADAYLSTVRSNVVDNSQDGEQEFEMEIGGNQGPSP